MGWYENNVGIEILMGKTLTDITQQGEDELYFTTADGERYKMYHEQDCCESVTIEDIVGNLDDLVGSPITMAEMVTQEGEPKDKWDDSSTWTFYKLATLNGYVTIRWYGTSNGYYSESVEFVKL